MSCTTGKVASVLKTVVVIFADARGCHPGHSKILRVFEGSVVQAAVLAMDASSN